MNLLQTYKPVFTLTLANRTLQLTREGCGFIFLSFAVGVGAINTGNNLLYLILAMCCSFIALSGTLSEMTLKNIRIEAESQKELYAEDTYPLTLKIINTKKMVPSYSLHVELFPDPRHSFDRDQAIYIFHILPGKAVEKSLMFTPLKRGKLQIKSCQLATSFPFGFFVKMKSVPIHVQATVFPPVRPIQLPSSSESSLEGEGQSKQRGDELDSLREFRPGDAISSIHWKASARTGNLRVKEFSGSGHRSYTIFLNILDSDSESFVAPELIEMRVIESASLAYHLIRRGDEVKLKTHDFETGYGNSESHLAYIMKYLAFAGAEPLTCDKPDKQEFVAAL